MTFNWLSHLFTNHALPALRSRAVRRHPSRYHANTALCVEYLEDRKLLTMTAPVAVAVGATINDVQVADINGDGKSDIIGLSSAATAVSVQIGNGDGTFQAAINSPSGGYSTGMNIADYNNDGRLDIATNNGSSIDILYGNGDGSFQLPAIYGVGAYANDMKSADFNHDGFCDIITASTGYGGTSQLLLNSGTGTFPTTKNIAISALGYHVEIGDLNNDGNEDLIESGSSSVGILMGQGDGTFRNAGYILTPYMSAPALADFNADGKSDLAVSSSGQLKVYSGDGLGGFMAPTTYPVTSGTSIAVADMDGNGTSDIVTNLGQVAFGRGDGTFYSPTNYTTPSLHMALSDFNGDGGVDVVSTTGAALSGISLSFNANNDATVLSGAVALRLTAPDVVSAGVPFAVTVSAVNANGDIVPGFTGTVAVSGATGSQPVSYTFSAADAGTATITTATTLFTSGVQTVTATSAFLPAATTNVTVTPAAVAKFSISANATTVAGQTTSVTVTVTDIFGNPAQGYFGTIHFSSTDVQAGLPADYTFTAADAGTHTFATILKTAGTQTIRASDTVTTALTGVTSAVSVTPGEAAALKLSGGGGYIGSANTVTITAIDSFGNTATTFNGTVRLTASDPSTTISGDAVLTNGISSVTVTSITLGAQILTATDIATGLVVGAETIVVTPGWAVRFTATPLAATVAGVSQGTTVTAYDAYGNVSTVYTGTVLITGTDSRASGYYTFTTADAGVHTIAVVLKTAGTQTVTIQDLFNPAVSVTQSGIQVTSAAAATITTSTLSGTVAGVAQSYTVTARDAFGNIATGYRGTVSASSSDTQAALTAAYIFTAADAGVHTFSITFKSAGGQTITVTDTANVGSLAFTNFQRDIPVTAGAVVGLSARAPSNVTAGVAFSMTVSAVDAFGNVVSNYVGKIHFTGPSGTGNILPTDYTFTAADSGSHVFSVTLSSTGTQTINFADLATNSIKGSTSVKVVTGTTSSGGGGGGGGTTSGGGTSTGGGGSGGGKKVV